LQKEFESLESAKKFLENEYGCTVDIVKGDDTDNPRAMKATPSKPGIAVE